MEITNTSLCLLATALDFTAPIVNAYEALCKPVEYFHLKFTRHSKLFMILSQFSEYFIITTLISAAVV